MNRICTTEYGRDPEQKYRVKFIADRNGHVLSYPDFQYSGDVLSGPDFRIEAFVRDTGRLEGKKIAFNQYEDKNMGWIFYNVYDLSLIHIWQRAAKYLSALFEFRHSVRQESLIGVSKCS